MSEKLGVNFDKLRFYPPGFAEVVNAEAADTAAPDKGRLKFFKKALWAITGGAIFGLVLFGASAVFLASHGGPAANNYLLMGVFSGLGGAGLAIASLRT